MISKKCGKDQESIQSSTTPECLHIGRGYDLNKNKKGPGNSTITHCTDQPISPRGRVKER